MGGALSGVPPPLPARWGRPDLGVLPSARGGGLPGSAIGEPRYHLAFIEAMGRPLFDARVHAVAVVEEHVVVTASSKRVVETREDGEGRARGSCP
eukprot:8527235-Pyramimonas_sp.AAC.1